MGLIYSPRPIVLRAHSDRVLFNDWNRECSYKIHQPRNLSLRPGQITQTTPLTDPSTDATDPSTDVTDPSTEIYRLQDSILSV